MQQIYLLIVLRNKATRFSLRPAQSCWCIILSPVVWTTAMLGSLVFPKRLFKIARYSRTQSPMCCWGPNCKMKLYSDIKWQHLMITRGKCESTLHATCLEGSIKKKYLLICTCKSIKKIDHKGKDTNAPFVELLSRTILRVKINYFDSKTWHFRLLKVD